MRCTSWLAIITKYLLSVFGFHALPPVALAAVTAAITETLIWRTCLAAVVSEHAQSSIMNGRLASIRPLPLHIEEVSSHY